MDRYQKKCWDFCERYGAKTGELKVVSYGFNVGKTLEGAEKIAKLECEVEELKAQLKEEKARYTSLLHIQKEWQSAAETRQKSLQEMCDENRELRERLREFRLFRKQLRKMMD